MDTLVLRQDLNRAYGLDLGDAATTAVLEALLAEKINALIQNDFGVLVQLLYRIDVNEKKLRELLEENVGEDAGRLIARLIMQRQWQKIESRCQYRSDKKGDAPDEEERW